MSELHTACSKCGTHWSDVDILADGKCASCLQTQIKRMRGVCILLANKLAHYTGYSMPKELRDAEVAEAAGAESWDGVRFVYVDENGHKAAGGE
jgi:hypothetical protein